MEIKDAVAALTQNRMQLENDPRNSELIAVPVV
jgi:hypothetical protein